mmetsp:Transcript_34224/g.67670  ORF Transcript_34224/g.67670 Transcript_34224/m.67670 type:complete len:92 (-) Transcript_34224:74-349(-)
MKNLQNLSQQPSLLAASQLQKLQSNWVVLQVSRLLALRLLELLKNRPMPRQSMQKRRMRKPPLRGKRGPNLGPRLSVDKEAGSEGLRYESL